MDQITVSRELVDFERFCYSFDVKAVIASADTEGNTPDHQQAVYALAILRALFNGHFGEDRRVQQAAVSALWERGYSKGFNAESFNEVFDEFFVYW